ncbi:hypothetical protein ACFQ7F_34675 [Streptomyces sp. NPDC056486]|uniref:hypothetical protein n=1 Tax=Streptomyces sp. NPDC056486 TaxID=3345835 RepID=UPI0036878471
MKPGSRTRWTPAGTVAALTVFLLVVSSVPSFAADGGSSSGELLDPLNVKTPEGVPIDRYEFTTGGSGGVIASVQSFLTSGIFALSRTITGFTCWLVDWVYAFPLLDKLAGPAQDISDAYQTEIIGPLGIAGIFLAWAFVFGLVLIMRGRVARGAGEILLTLMIAALAATTFVRPAMLLGYDGPLQQTQRAALEAATITANGGDKAKGADPCDMIAGAAQNACRQANAEDASSGGKSAKDKKACDAIAGPAKQVCLTGERKPIAADVSKPITRTLTTTLVVQPYMLLQYGRIIEKDSPLYKPHKDRISPPKPGSAGDKCDHIKGPANKYCQKGQGKFGTVDAMEKKGEEGEAVAAYMNEMSWSRVFGAVMVLIASLIIGAVIISMAFAMLAAQFGCVVASVVALGVLAWALLPGPNRAALWKWLGIYASAAIVLFGVSVFIPLFGVAAQALLTDNSTPMLERLFMLDGLAITALALHRKMLRSGDGMGRRFAQRMRFAKIGGSHMMGEQAAATASAISSLGYGGSAGAGGSSAHLSFMNRHAGLAASMNALSDPTGMPGHPGAFLAEARAEGRRAFAPVQLGLRAAHTALIGPPRAHQKTSPVGPDGKPQPTVIDGRTGKVISGGGQGGIHPIGTRLEAGLKRTRGGRVLVGTSKAAYYSTVGLPATWTRVRRAKSQLTDDISQEVGRQGAHYGNVAAKWKADSRAGLDDITSPVRRTYEAVAQPIQNATRLHDWQDTWLDDTGRPRYFGGPATPEGHVPDDVWMPTFPWEPGAGEEPGPLFEAPRREGTGESERREGVPTWDEIVFGRPRDPDGRGDA